MFIFDAHLDLAMNALEWNLDFTRPLDELRQRERGLTDKKDRGHGAVCLPEMRRSKIGLCVATQIARYVKPGNPLPGWHSPEQAWAQTQGQLAWYHAMTERGEMAPITSRAELDAHLRVWSASSASSETSLPIGYILSLEGADSILSMAHLEKSFADRKSTRLNSSHVSES